MPSAPKCTYFRGIIFVPWHPDGTQVEERILLPRRRTQQAFVESPDTTDESRSWVSDDVRGMWPDINHGTIKLALAPNCHENLFSTMMISVEANLLKSEDISMLV